MAEVKETEDVVKFACALANAISDAGKDGKWTALDVGSFVSPLLKVGPAVSGAEDVPAEMKSASPEQLASLLALAKEELKLAPEHAKAELIAEEVLDIALKLVSLAQKLKA